jgi:outer membrane cobalamin receptor
VLFEDCQETVESAKNMLNRHIPRLCGSLSLAALCLSAVPAPAEDAAHILLSPEVIVSASRLGSEIAAPMRDMIVIDAEEIARRAPASITQLLGSLPGVDIRTRGPWGVQADLEIDGSTFSQVLILLDGVRVNDPQTGHHNLNLALDPADLERVELTYGAGSAVHGPDALGGVINLVPKSSVLPRADVAARWGASLDDVASGVASDASLRWGWQGDWGSAWVSGGKRRSDGYREDTDFDEDRVFVHAELPTAGGQLSIDAGVQDKVFGARDFYAPYPSREWTTAQSAAVTYHRGALTLRGYGRRHRDRFVLIAADPAVYDNRHRSVLAGTEGFVRHRMGGTDLAIGGELVHEGIDSNNLGDRSRLRGSLFGELGRRIGTHWRLLSGLRVDHHESFGWEASPSLSASRDLGDGRIFASAARSYRAPSFTETWYSDPNNVGNADLGAERSWQFEAGSNMPVVGFTVEGAVFLRQESNLIDYVRPADQPPWQAQNLGEMETVGVRLRARRNWRHVRAEAGFTWVDKEQTLATGLESKYVFTHPVQQLTARLHHDLPMGAAADWQLGGRNRLAPLDDYAVLDLNVSLPVRPGRVLLRLRNLTNERYEAVAGVPMPGRWYGLETRVDL